MNSLFLCLTYVFVMLDPNDDAIAALSEHFLTVMDSLRSGTFRHYSAQRYRVGTGKFVYDRKTLEGKLTFDKKPRCFLLQPLALRRKLSDSLSKVVRAFRKFDFTSYSSVLSRVFGADAIVDQGSGIDELFPPKSAGRPRLPRLEAMDLIADILFQVRDGKTEAPFVMVCWKGQPLKSAQWVPVASLTQSTSQLWSNLLEQRFRSSIYKNAPTLRLTGGPVEIVWDWSS